MKNNRCALCPLAAEYEYAGQNLCSGCVSLEAAKSQTLDGPKKKPYRNKGKCIDEVPAKENFSGEASPYWNHVAQQPWQSENTQLAETPEANPDVLPESASFYASTQTDEEEIRADILREVTEQLTPLQRDALALCEASDYTEESAAEKLGMTRRAFRTIINRIRKTIETKIEQRERSLRWQK